MSAAEKPIKIAVLDDYQGVALQMADWSALRDRASIEVFSDHLADPDRLVERLAPFDVVCAMRERTPLPRGIIDRLPRLKLIASTGRRNAAIDTAAAEARGVAVRHTRGSSVSAIELTWALILAACRNLVPEAVSVRSGGWQITIGREIRGKTLAALGLGRIGGEVAHIGQAFGMSVIVWDERVSPERAAQAGVERVPKKDFFGRADVLTIHFALVEATRDLIGARELALMKPTAWLVNTSRGPIVDEPALVEALAVRRIAGAALDVFDAEPLPADHPFRTLDNVLATPHVGYVSREQYEAYYGETVAAIAEWLAEQDAAR
jgi:phosphoglycerate dehydrogenase-like enzyme